MANGNAVNVGEAVGIIAAQSIGEPGTQLTMRTFHTGGVASAEDITQGLPRVEELFEGRKPKKTAILAEDEGVLTTEDEGNIKRATIRNPKTGEEKQFMIPFGIKYKQELEGTTVAKGEIITDGVPNPHDILRLNGDIAVQDYLIKEVQKVYRMQGVDINDKHIEVIVRQMIKKVRIIERGSTDFLVGSLADRYEVDTANAAIRQRIENGEGGLSEATYEVILLGITKAALATDSFMSAASFQETTRVLTDAAIHGKVDHLLGLKENVIIGRLIPAGTGLSMYRNVEPEIASPEIENDDTFSTEKVVAGVQENA